MRIRTLFAAGLLLTTSALVAAPPASATPGYSCTTTASQCVFRCDAGQTVTITVLGTDTEPSSSSGSATCGTAAPACSAQAATCTDARDTATSSLAGACNLHIGRSITCSAA